MMSRSLRLLALAGGLLAGFVTGRAVAQPALDVPVACRMWQDCFVQNYYDDDAAASSFKDYTCGSLGYDTHNGTDFRVPTMAEMRKGVDVVAAAAGTVVRLRDGVADTGLPPEGVSGLKGQMAGNAVVIDHGDGWETQYSHLRQGSIVVKSGDKVVAGQKLAFMGFSGNTQFPHVDLAVRHNGKTVDPYVGETAEPYICGGARKPLWSEAAARTLAYHPSGVLKTGFAPEQATMEKINDGAYAATSFDSPPIVMFWGYLFGGQAGDRVRIEMRGPDGKVLTTNETVLDRPLAQLFRSVGQRKPATGWAAGRYSGFIALVRGGREVARGESTAEVRP
jgi:murein DD-endopeptidase MepM/ murein hydrolase activator NlpD